VIVFLIAKYGLYGFALSNIIISELPSFASRRSFSCDICSIGRKELCGTKTQKVIAGLKRMHEELKI
jgi:hypothetical protein